MRAWNRLTTSPVSVASKMGGTDSKSTKKIALTVYSSTIASFIGGSGACAAGFSRWG